MTESWHLPQQLLDSWISGRAEPGVAAATELHLQGCSHCRARVDRSSPGVPDLDAVWLEVRARATAPRDTRLQRGLRRLGMSAADSFLVAATPSLLGSWVTALAVFALCAGLAPYFDDAANTQLYLLLAPLVPLGAVAFSYGPDVNPAYEQEVATPYSALRLLLLRTAAVLLLSMPLLTLAGLLLPGRVAALWLLPGASLVTALLAASTWLRPVPVAGALALVWGSTVLAVSLRDDPARLVAASSLLAYAVVTAIAFGVFLSRADALNALRGQS